MQLTYQLTQKDFYESFIAHRNRRPLVKWTLRLFVAGLVGMATTGAIVSAATHNTNAISNVFPLILLVLIWVALFWIAPWRAARTQFLKQPAVRGLRTTVLDNTGIHQKWDGGSSDVEWENYIRWLEAKNQILLYSSPFAFGMISKRAMNDAQLSELRTLLTQNIRSN
jgi:hypothetical protein